MNYERLGDTSEVATEIVKAVIDVGGDVAESYFDAETRRYNANTLDDIVRSSIKMEQAEQAGSGLEQQKELMNRITMYTAIGGGVFIIGLLIYSLGNR